MMEIDKQVLFVGPFIHTWFGTTSQILLFSTITKHINSHANEYEWDFFNEMISSDPMNAL